jgi:hypothetical protein
MMTSTGEKHASGDVKHASKMISAEEAGDLYDALGRGKWQDDARTGRYLAVEAEVEIQLARALWNEQRRQDGLAVQAIKPLPEWVLIAVPDYVESAPSLQMPTGFVSLMTNPMFVEIVERLFHTGGVEWVRCLSAAQRAELLKEVQGVFATFKPAQDRAMQAFFVGTRSGYHLKGWGEPKPAEVRLLAAAIELDPIVRGLDHSRKLWEDRIRRWKRDWGNRWPTMSEFLDRGAAAVRDCVPASQEK